MDDARETELLVLIAHLSQQNRVLREQLNLVLTSVQELTAKQRGQNERRRELNDHITNQADELKTLRRLQRQRHEK